MGFDYTTEHRMRIPESRVPRTEERPEASEFRSYFSVREYSMVEEIYLYPFVVEANTIALLMIVDSPYLQGNHRFLSVICAAVSDAVAELIFHNREERIRFARKQATFTLSELIAHFETQQAEHREDTRFILLSANQAVGALVQAGEAADEYRMRQDVMRILSAMVSGIATIAEVGQGRVLLAMYDGDTTDLDLLVHQLSHQIEGLFPELTGQEKFSVESLPSPPAEGSLEEHLRSLLA